MIRAWTACRHDLRRSSRPAATADGSRGRSRRLCSMDLARSGRMCPTASTLVASHSIVATARKPLTLSARRGPLHIRIRPPVPIARSPRLPLLARSARRINLPPTDSPTAPGRSSTSGAARHSGRSTAPALGRHETPNPGWSTRAQPREGQRSPRSDRRSMSLPGGSRAPAGASARDSAWASAMRGPLQAPTAAEHGGRRPPRGRATRCSIIRLRAHCST